MIPVPQTLATAAQLESATQGRIRATDPFVEEALGAATEAVRSVCGWHVGPTRTEKGLLLDGRGGSIITLPSLHVTGVASVIDNGVTDPVPLIEGTDFSWSENGILERLCAGYPSTSLCWSRKRRAIEVTFSHGYDLSQIRGVMLLVCTVAARSITAAKMAGYVREQAGTNQAELGKVGGLVSAPINAALLDHEVRTLRNYIIPSGGA
jgi:hypothetical protein